MIPSGLGEQRPQPQPENTAQAFWASAQKKVGEQILGVRLFAVLVPVRCVSYVIC